MSERETAAASRFRRGARSLAAKVAILVLIFVACPVIVYVELRDADAEKNALILESVQEQGRLIAKSLEPLLRRAGEASAPDLQKELQNLAAGALRVKVLFRPASAPRQDSYFYVASLPPLPADYLIRERENLIRTRILDRLGDTCAGNKALNVRHINPAGETELLSSMTPIHNDAGCWVVLTAYPPTGLAGTAIGQPYWKKPEVRIAAAIYVAMAVLVFFLFFSVWRSLQRFGALAQSIRERPSAEGSFAELNSVPELGDVAREFDLMVGRLGASERAIRHAAEENAHALKTPIAVISQSVEPLKRAVANGDRTAKRAIDLIERSVDRLDSLVGAARRMDETMADLISPPREKVDLTLLLTRMIEAYGETAGMKGVRLTSTIAPDVHVTAGEDLLETVLENILDNALGFSPSGGSIDMVLRVEGPHAEVTVTDEGPGVDPRNLDRIFDRYFSDRPRADSGAEDDTEPDHFGMGLWIVRRNIEAIGGEVAASNPLEGGLAITVRLPLDR